MNGASGTTLSPLRQARSAARAMNGLATQSPEKEDRGGGSFKINCFYFFIRPRAFMITSYSTIFFFTRARDSSGPINSVLKPF
jgi:hypothetical protein